MKVLVLGASGKTGVEVVRQGLAAGHEMTAFVRSPARLSVNGTGLVVKTGDARNVADLRDALEGREAVITTLGSNRAGDALIGRSTAALLQVAGELGVRRVLMLSVARNYKATFVIRLLGRVMKAVVADRWAGEDALMHSSLEGAANIGCPQYVTVRELAELAAQIAGKRIQLKSVPGPVGVQSRNFSNERIYTTGWKSRFDLKAGLSLTYPWIKQQVDAAKK